MDRHAVLIAALSGFALSCAVAMAGDASPAPRVLSATSASGALRATSDPRLDPNDHGSPFGGVASLFIDGRLATAVAISPRHVLTAAHSFDLDNDGAIDSASEIALFFHHEGDLSHVVIPRDIERVDLHPGFTGFAAPVVNDDLALITLREPLPAGVLSYTMFDGEIEPGATIWMVGYGMAGDGERGFREGSASFTVKRVGANAADEFYEDDEGSGVQEIWRFDFDGPSGSGSLGGASLGVTLESTLGRGDSGGPGFITLPNGELRLVAINTFVCGPGDIGRFGSGGGGMLVSAYRDWIDSIITPRLVADANGDGRVDAADLTRVLLSWALPDADLTGDGTVDRDDLALVLEHWGETAPIH